jgi:hypothetical protein
MSYRQLGEKGKAIADLESSLEQEIDPKNHKGAEQHSQTLQSP